MPYSVTEIVLVKGAALFRSLRRIEIQSGDIPTQRTTSLPAVCGPYGRSFRSRATAAAASPPAVYHAMVRSGVMGDFSPGG